MLIVFPWAGACCFSVIVVHVTAMCAAVIPVVEILDWCGRLAVWVLVADAVSAAVCGTATVVATAAICILVAIVVAAAAAAAAATAAVCVCVLVGTTTTVVFATTACSHVLHRCCHCVAVHSRVCHVGVVGS